MLPIRVDSTQHLLFEISQRLHDHGWALICTPYDGLMFQYTVGLQSSFKHPELEVFGLTQNLGQRFLENLVRRIKAGEHFQAGDFFSGLVTGYDLFLVDNPADPNGPPLTHGRLRLIWPDAHHRYPWQPGCDSICAAQVFVPPNDGIDMKSLRELMAVSTTVN